MAELTARQAAPVGTRDWATDFDHFDPAFVADPDAVWAELRDRCPVAHTNQYGGLNVVTRWHDVAAVAQDTVTFSSRRNVVSDMPTSHPGAPLPPINDDPPLHTTRRRVMLPFFTAKATERWAELVRQICRGALAAIEGRTECDLAVDYAQVIPAELTAQMLGVPLDDVPQFRIWLRDLLQVGPNDIELLRATTREVREYMARLLERRRQEPGGDDLVAYLLDQQLDGEPIPDRMLVNMLFLLLVAGIDTTWSGIGFSLLHLARHPADRARLAADPSLIPAAVEELLRAYPPVWVARIATTDTEVGGCPVAAGEWVVMGLPAANRDPEVYERPDDVVIDREHNIHASFGLGVHRCLGSNLARMEMRVALEEWLARYPDFELLDPAAVTMAGGQIRGPRSVPARLLS